MWFFLTQSYKEAKVEKGPQRSLGPLPHFIHEQTGAQWVWGVSARSEKELCHRGQVCWRRALATPCGSKNEDLPPLVWNFAKPRRTSQPHPQLCHFCAAMLVILALWFLWQSVVHPVHFKRPMKITSLISSGWPSWDMRPWPQFWTPLKQSVGSLGELFGDWILVLYLSLMPVTLNKSLLQSGFFFF